jgi:serine/threonine protein kinase
MLESFIDRLIIETIPEGFAESASTIVRRLTSLVNCNYSELYDVASQELDFLRSVLATPGIPPEIEQVVDLSFKAIVTVMRTVYAVRGDDSETSPKSPVPERSADPRRTAIGQQLVLCRICDELVAVEHFDVHTLSCSRAYRSESRVAEIDAELLRLQDLIAHALPPGAWPGTQTVAIEEALPMLHAQLLIDRTLQISVKNPDAAVQCAQIDEALTFLAKHTYVQSLLQILPEVKASVAHKQQTATAFEEALHIVKRTQISGRGRTMELSVSISEFRFLKRISAGAYARVFLAVKEKTGDVYAIKVLPRHEVQQKNQVKRVLLEKDVLLRFQHRNIINFYYSIVAPVNLYLVMEYLPGGDLFSLLKNLGSLREDPTRIYVFQIAHALAYLHSLHIIHRDLKPDNVLITSEGSLKLTDFGLSYNGLLGRNSGGAADEGVAEARSLVGTPDYISPEIILRKTHTYTADWWSLGVILYELLAGEAPFHSNCESEIYRKILKGVWQVPPTEEPLSHECLECLRGLLMCDPARRLGAGGAHEVLEHPWFAGLDAERLRPPFVPELADVEDTTYFHSRYSSSDAGDADIEEDIRIARSKLVQSARKTTRRSSLVLSERINAIRMMNLPNEDGIESFPAVALEHLEGANREALKKVMDFDAKPARSFSSLASFEDEMAQGKRSKLIPELSD